MRRRRTVAYALPPVVEVPTGNVHIVPMQRADPEAAAPEASGDADQEPEPRWVIRDGDGIPLEPTWNTRAAALQRMGLLAFRGACLPLTLYGPDGRPTGDRLP